MSERIEVPAYVEVSLGAIERNYSKLCDGTQGSQVAAVVKANAYGLGADRVAEKLFDAGCRKFFVATLEEGVSLRGQLANDAEIYILEGFRAGSEQSFVAHALSPVINTTAQAADWIKIGRPCALHVDTGMTRLGVGLDELAELFADKKFAEQLGIEYLMTHLSCADEPDNPRNAEQLERFNAARDIAGEVKVSIANSAGAFLDQRFHGDLIRPGIALYGGNPFAEHENPMETVARLYARVLQVRDISEEQAIGYGATFEAAAGARIATVGVGYADGYPRMLGNTALAAVAGIRVPIVGRVSMDLTTLDVTDLDETRIEVGGYVEMFGSYVPVDEIAALCSTISYEILTGLNPRLPRVYVE